MDDILLVIVIPVLFGLGFIPIIAFNRFLNQNRSSIVGKSERGASDLPGEKGAQLDEFERTGVVFFEEEAEKNGGKKR